MPQKVPISDMKIRLKGTKMAQNPLYAARNGKGAFRDMYQKQKIVCELEISENQIKDGKTRDAAVALSVIKETYGL
ncbi:MAG: hypothetical protein SPF89_02955 [Sphaerochaetaceae bacterium]|nr:hypothetical protein [Spirochaetales bacterium]MDY5499043.1 hypothetical protein [Sphaerochaetaceae bacterium]